MPYLTGNSTYDASLFAAEVAKQAALVGTPTAAAAKTADLVYARAILVAANKSATTATANSIQPTAAITELYSLGVNT